MGLQAGPGKLFVIPDERHKIRSSGLVLPSIVQDDAFSGTVVAVGAGAWLGQIRGRPGLTYEPGDHLGRPWDPVRRETPCKVGDVVHYEPERVTIMPLGWSDQDGTVYVLDQRNVLAVEEG